MTLHFSVTGKSIINSLCKGGGAFPKLYNVVEGAGALGSGQLTPSLPRALWVASGSALNLPEARFSLILNGNNNAVLQGFVRSINATHRASMPHVTGVLIFRKRW